MIALVTGSSRGIGRSIICEFARRGIDVVINYYKNEDKVIFPNTVSLVRPTMGMKQNRLNYFSWWLIKNSKNSTND